jgi:hypothetical protein
MQKDICESVNLWLLRHAHAEILTADDYHGASEIAQGITKRLSLGDRCPLR